MINIKLLKALNGDSIILSYGEQKKYHMLIDGGHGRVCFRQLRDFIADLHKENNKIDVVILTHIDSDHIDGIKHLYSQDNFDFSIVEEMWFNFGEAFMAAVGSEGKKEEINLYGNGTKISWQQGRDLESILQSVDIKRESFVKAMDKFSIGEAQITILSPSIEILKQLAEYGSKEEIHTAQISAAYDYGKSVAELNEKEFEGIVSLTNKSSIAFLFEYKETSLLFLGDADAETIVNSLKELGYSNKNKLKLAFCKVAHHASKHNTSNELIQMLDCRNYLLSTQHTAQGRPSKECLSRIICNSTSTVKFYCNYDIDIDRIFSKEELLKYEVEFIILNENGIDVEEERQC